MYQKAANLGDEIAKYNLTTLLEKRENDNYRDIQQQISGTVKMTINDQQLLQLRNHGLILDRYNIQLSKLPYKKSCTEMIRFVYILFTFLYME